MVRVQNIIFGAIIVLLLFSLIGCSTEQSVNSSQTTENLDKKESNLQPVPTTEEQKQDLVEDKGIIIDRLRFNDTTMSGEIVKNKLWKTAEIKIKMSLNDSTEYADFMGEQSAMAPFMINMVCGLFTSIFFNQTALEELRERGNMSIDSAEENPLKGYTITKSTVEFNDYETKEKIADCVASRAGWDNIKFNAYRTYNASFFGAQIGELSENNEN